MNALAKGPATPHLDPDQPGAFTEAKCQDAAMIVPPALVLGAHFAPLDISSAPVGDIPRRCAETFS